MASNNSLVLEIVLENGRSAVLEKQQEEIKQVRKQYWDILMFVYTQLLADNGCRSPAAHVAPMYSAFVKDAALVASAEPTLLQARREELDHCKAQIDHIQAEIARRMDDDDLLMWINLMRMSVPTLQDESSH